MKKIKIIKSILFPLIGCAILFIAWLIASAVVDNSILFPTIGETFAMIWSILSQGDSYISILSTIGRTLLAFIISFLMAIIFAILSYNFEGFRKTISPIITILRTFPTMSIIFIVLVWTTAANTPIFVGMLILFPIIYNSLFSALSAIDSDLITMSKAFKVSRYRQVRMLYMPTIMPVIFSQSRNALGLGIKIIISAEVIAQALHSIGSNMAIANIWLETSKLFAWTILAILCAFLLEGIVTLLQFVYNKCRRPK